MRKSAWWSVMMGACLISCGTNEPGPEVSNSALEFTPVNEVSSDAEDFVRRAGKIMQEDPGSRGFPSSAAIWPMNEIRVGWEDPTSSNARERGWVKDAVTRTWSSHSAVRFSGWEKADAKTNIRIQVSDEGPHCKNLGRFIDKMKNGIVLNFTFNNWSQDARKIGSPLSGMDWREFMIRAVAVHEFGHALGLAHEHNRKDAVNRKKCPQGGDGDFHYGKYDLSSVMNYDNPKYSNYCELSETDKGTIGYLYPANPERIPKADGAWKGSGTVSGISVSVTWDLKQSKTEVTGTARVSYQSGTVKRDLLLPVRGWKVNGVLILYALGKVTEFNASNGAKTVSFNGTNGTALVDGKSVKDFKEFERICRDEMQFEKYIPQKSFCTMSGDGKSFSAEVPVGGQTFKVQLKK